MPQQSQIVYPSVREAWKSIQAGTARRANASTRRVSCPTIDVPTSSSLGSSATTTSTITEEDEYEPVEECTVFVRVATDDTESEKEVDISQLSDEDIQTLKRTDPFLYYSIAANRRSVAGGGGYINRNNGGGNRTERTSRRSSLPAELLANADNARSRQAMQQEDSIMEVEDEPRRESIVRRNRRMSTEVHPTLVCDELLREMHELDGRGMDNDGGSLFDEEDLELLEQELDDFGLGLLLSPEDL